MELERKSASNETRKRLQVLEANALRLSQSKGYRDFLKTSFALWEQVGLPMSYAEFASKAGFSARSFPRAVIIGDKRLSESSLPQFVHALQLRGPLRELFRLLVAKEEQLLSVISELPKNPSGSVDAMIAKLQNKIARQGTSGRKQLSPELIEHRVHALIFAASGSLSAGSSFDAIAARTGISMDQLKINLIMMQEREMVRLELNQEWVWPLMFHIDLTEQSTSKKVQADFVHSLEDAKLWAQNDFKSSNRLFFQSVFSIQRSKIPELKRALREVLMTFVDESEVSDADSLVRLVSCLNEESFADAAD